MEDMVTMKNYEEFILSYIDDELNAEEEKSLLALAAEHPEVAAELELYQSLKLQPDTTATYGDISGLLKTEPAAKTITLGNWKTYAAAACVLLAVCIFFFNRNNNINEPEVMTAQNTTNNQLEASIPTQPSEAEVATEEPVQEIIEEPDVIKESQLRPKQPVAHIAMETKKQPVKEQAVMTSKPVEPVVVKQDKPIEKSIAKTTTTPKKEAVIKQKKPVVIAKEELQPVVAQQPTASIAEGEPVVANIENPKEKKLISVSGPFSGSIANIFKKKVESAKNATAQLKETDVVVQIGKKELFTVRL